MTQPPAYERSYSFTDFASGSPSSQPPGVKLDDEFDGIELTTRRIRQNLALIQRDDGRLAPSIVGLEQLSAAAVAALRAVDDGAIFDGLAALAAQTDTAVAAVLAAQAAVETISQTGVGRVYSTWFELQAASGSSGDGAIVMRTDLGTHVDPVNGNTVNNRGTYSYSQSPAGWRWLGDQVAQGIQGADSTVPGPSNNTRATLAVFKAAAITDKTSLYANALWTWTPGNFSAVPASQIDRQIVKADSTSLAIGAWTKSGGQLYAGDYGIIGGGADETAAVQSFLDLCASLGRTACFGSLTIRISGPLRASCGIVFEEFSYGSGGPGFRVSGSGYTALTVTGAVSDFVVTLYGDPAGVVAYNLDGTVSSDSRTPVNGILFGELTTNTPLLLSVIRSARVYNLAGFGIRHGLCWDSTFLAESVERCGSSSWFAWSTEGNVGGQNCNESTWVRVQVEQSCARSHYVSPFTLSCTFLKFHSERVTAQAGVMTWQFGPGNYSAPRCSAMNPSAASMLVLGQSGTFDGLRVEGDIPVAVNSNGGVIDFRNSEGTTFTPAAGSNGGVNFFGGSVTLVAAAARWRAFGSAIASATIGDVAAGSAVELIGCDTVSLNRSSDNAEVVMRDGSATLVGGGQWRAISIDGRARVALSGGSASFANCKMFVGPLAEITGDIVLNRVGTRWGGRLLGNLTHGAINSVLFAGPAEVSGTIFNHGPPVDGLYLDGLTEGMSCKNLRPTLLGTAGSQTAIFEWRYIGAGFRALSALTGT